MENSTIQSKARYNWIDNIKAAACILVVLGHFFMSMEASGLISGGTAFNYFINTIYTFHVQLFFVCSGFLYQKSNRVHTLKSWKRNALDKLLNLGVPYFTFSLATLVLKILFPDNLTTQATDILNTLFINPTAPYWYLYTLFFFFLIIPCMRNKKDAYCLFAVSLILKIAHTVLVQQGIALPYIVSTIMGKLIWFSAGMLLCFIDLSGSKKALKIICVLSGTGAIASSLLLCTGKAVDPWASFLTGALFVAFAVTCSQLGKFKAVSKFSSWFSKYFMPVFLMHTVFAAGLRSILFKLGIDSSFLHILLGLPAGFIFPMIVYKVMEKLPVLMFFVYPKKSLSIIKGSKQ
ncbi:MAG: acyltransferase family protein [Eubacterium sp.]